ncbi:hypothetical protein Tco_1345991 [Tanacetum coccineum]
MEINGFVMQTWEKLVSNLLRRRNDHCLNLTSWVVAEAFSSIEDPFVIVCSGHMSPKIHVQCAIFVDLQKSREEIKCFVLKKHYTQSSGWRKQKGKYIHCGKYIHLDGAFDKLNELLQAFVASPEEVENSVIEDVVDWLKSPWPDAKEFHKHYVVHSESHDAKNTKVKGNKGINNKGKRKRQFF